jgi:hypothetical protein
MGLDMSIVAKVYNFDNKDKLETEFDFEINYIELELAYWRKCNAIHNWFIKNSGEEDNCNPIYIKIETLVKLKSICEKEINNKNNKNYKSELEPIAGFFFGSTEKDEWYYKDMEYSVKQLDKIIKWYKHNNNISLYYQASW